MAEASPKRSSRRRFLKRLAQATGALFVGTVGWSLAEPLLLEVRRVRIAVPRLREPFRGLRVAFLSDVHHGPFTGIGFVERVIERTNALAPDLCLLGGDYVHRSARYIAPCLAVHARLAAPLGVFGVLGNHDHWEGAAETRAAMREAGITELTNDGRWLQRGGARLRIAGVGDLWEDTQDLDRALGDASASDAAILLSHNPDFAESIADPRVGLCLAGHTHGGQVDLPGFGAPYLPSRYGQKYKGGLVRAPRTQVYVSRGLGCVTPPVRFRCRPELTVIELA